MAPFGAAPVLAVFIGLPAGAAGPPFEVPPEHRDSIAELDRTAERDAPAGALPEPLLSEPFEIGEALADPARVDQAVVSLVTRMGIRLPDSLLRGLIEMERADLRAMQQTGRAPYSFKNLHAAIHPLLPDLSIEDMAAGYMKAYEAAPDALAPQVLQGMPIEPGTPLTRVQFWLLLVDGFAPPPAAPRLAQLGGSRLSQSRGPAWGTASLTLPHIPSPDPMLNQQDFQHLLTQLPMLAFSIPFDIAPMTSQTHEGHGGPGAPVSIDMAIAYRPQPVASPTTGQPLLRIRTPDLANRMIAWEINDLQRLLRHGSLNRPQGVPLQTDNLGKARLTFSPKAEIANGQGDEATEIATVRGSINMWDLLSTQYDLLPIYRGFVPGDRVTQGFLQVDWHAVTAIRVSLENWFMVSLNLGFLAEGNRIGRDTASGVLELQADGSYAGFFEARANAVQVGNSRIGGPRCPRKRSDGKQILRATGRSVGGLNPHTQSKTHLDGNAQVAGYLALEFTPLTWPDMTTTDRCQGLIFRDPEPTPFIPFNDARWTIQDGSYAIAIPAPGEWIRYRDVTAAAALAPLIGAAQSYWTIEVHRDDPAP